MLQPYVLLTVFARRDAGDLLKSIRKITAGVKGQLYTDIQDTHIGGAKKHFGSLDLFAHDIFVDGATHLLFELAGEIILGITGALCQITDGKFLIDMYTDGISPIVKNCCDYIGEMPSVCLASQTFWK